MTLGLGGKPGFFKLIIKKLYKFIKIYLNYYLYWFWDLFFFLTFFFLFILFALNTYSCQEIEIIFLIFIKLLLFFSRLLSRYLLLLFFN